MRSRDSDPRRRLLRTLLIAGLFAGTATAGDEIRYTPLAVSGEQAPGLPPGIVFSMFAEEFTVRDDGEAFFHANVSGPGVNALNRSVFVHASAGAPPVIVARQSDPAPGLGDGVTFSFFSDSVSHVKFVGEDGVAFRASLAGPGIDDSNDNAFFVSNAGTTEVLVREGFPPPGFGPGTFVADRNILVQRAGPDRTLIGVTLGGDGVDPSNEYVIAELTPDGAGVLARQGDPVPAMGEGVSYGDVFARVISNERGGVGIDTFLDGVGVTPDDNAASFARPDAGAPLALYIREGDPVPGTDGAESFTGLVNFRTLNDAGELSFTATVRSETGETRNGVFTTAGGGLAEVARPGTPAPEIEGATIDWTFIYWMNNEGVGAFVAGIEGPGVDESNDTVLYRHEPGIAPSLVFREGDAVPGVSSPVEFRGLGSAQINDAGQILFEGSDAEGTRRGLFIADPGGTVRTVAIEGQTIDVARGGQPADPRVLRFQGTWHGRLRENGRVVFRTAFVGGGSAIVSASTRPEPCGPADLGDPFGVLDLADLGAFVGAFIDAEPLADLNADGVYDLADVMAFIAAFNAGCGA